MEGRTAKLAGGTLDGRETRGDERRRDEGKGKKSINPFGLASSRISAYQNFTSY
jgi:hypothetical protein